MIILWRRSYQLGKINRVPQFFNSTYEFNAKLEKTSHYHQSFHHRNQDQSLPIQFPFFRNQRRCYGVLGHSSNDEGIIQQIRRRLGFVKTETKKHVLKWSGMTLFVKVADEVQYQKFFEVCNLEDTFASWFIVMELHVWLICCRLMEEGDEGKIVRNAFLEAMWKDVDIRSKKLEGALPSARRTQVKELGEQFNTQLISYDEGLMSSDRVLAGAIWRRFLQHCPPQNYEELQKQINAIEMLLAYTRSQYARLHNLSKRDIILNQTIEWNSFDKGLIIDHPHSIAASAIRP